MGNCECKYRINENGSLCVYNILPEKVNLLYTIKCLVKEMEIKESKGYPKLNSVVEEFERRLFRANGELFYFLYYSLRGDWIERRVSEALMEVDDEMNKDKLCTMFNEMLK